MVEAPLRRAEPVRDPEPKRPELMPATTQCPHCQTVLNLPPEAAGRRLKCPKCGEKFQAGSPGSRPRTGAQPVDQARPASSVMANAPHGDEDIPLAPGDLRETFDVPLLGEDDLPARPATRGESSAAGLFDAPAPRRKPTAAEARRQARRCPSCSSIVPAGMSLCERCGLDLDTGQRIAVEEIYDEQPEYVPPAPQVPFGIVVVGGLAFLAGVLLACVAFQQYFAEGVQGAQLLGIVCLFGAYGAIQFLRGKSVRLLLAALMIGALVDVVALIFLPVYRANTQVPIEEQVVTHDLVDDAPPEISRLTDRLDMNQIIFGIALLLIDTAAFIYLLTPGVQRHFQRSRSTLPVS